MESVNFSERKRMKVFTNLINYLQLIIFFINSNKNNIIISSVGMIIALSCIAEAQIYIDSVQGKLLYDFIEDDGKKDHFDILINCERLIPNGEINQSFIEINKEPFYSAMEKSRTSNYLMYDIWTLTYGVTSFLPQVGTISSLSSKNIIINSFNNETIQKLADLMAQESRLPENENEIIVVNVTGAATTYSNITVGNNIIVRSGKDPGVNKTLKIVGIINLKFNDINSSTYQTLSYSTGTKDLLDHYWNDYSIITTHEILFDLFEQYRDHKYENMYSNYSNLLFIRGRIFLDRLKVQLFSIDQEKEKFSLYRETMIREYDELTSFSTSINFYLLDILDLFQYHSVEILTFLLLFSFPSIGIALFLIIYSFGLLRQKKQNIIGYMKSKGLTKNDIGIILIAEKFVELLISIPLAFLLAIPFCVIGLSSDGFLSFNNSKYNLVINLPSIIGLLLFFGVLLTFLVNFKYFLNIFRYDVTSIMKPTEDEVSTAFWKRNYIDIIILVIGVLGFSMLYLGVAASDLPGETYTLIYLIGVPSPFFLVIGSALFVSRTFPKFLSVLTAIFWQLEGGLSSFSLKSLLRNKQAASRSILLIMLTVCFGIIALTVPGSLENHYVHLGYYNTGSDIFLKYNEEEALNGSNPNLEDELLKFDEIDDFMPVAIQSRYARNAHYLMMGIDTEKFEKVAFFENNYGLSDSLSTLMEILESNHDTILLRKIDMTRMKKNVGDSIILQNTIYNVTTGEDQIVNTTELKIGGYFNYWPRLVTFETRDVEDGIFFVGNLSLCVHIQDTLFETATDYGYYIKLKPQADIKNVSRILYEKLHKPNENVIDNIADFSTSSSWRVFIGILNANIIIAFLTATFGVFLFSYNQILGREKEIGIERALGMDFLQSFRIIFTEGILLVGFGLFLGTLLGTILSYSYMFVITLRNLIPPFIMLFPVNLIVLAFIGFIILTIIGSAIPAYLSTRIDIDKALMVE